MERRTISSRAALEGRYSYSRAVVADGRVLVSGTAPIMPDDADPPADAYGQARRCLEIILNALAEAGAEAKQVVRTRVFITRASDMPEVGRALAEVFREVRPASTVVEVNLLDPRWLVEIEAEAVLPRCPAALPASGTIPSDEGRTGMTRNSPVPYGLHHTSLTVSDLERSLAFYRDTVGLTVVMQQEKEGGYLARITGYPEAHVRMAQLELPEGSHRIELFQYVAPPGERTPCEPRNVGITHICLLVENIHEAYERLRSVPGVEPYSEPVEIESGANKGGFGLYLRDPDGITLELFQPPQR